MSIELTNDQRQAVHAEEGRAVDVVDPTTAQHYVLLARDEYERVRPLLEQARESRAAETSGAEAEIPAGVLRSQRAFWHDLPELLKKKDDLRKWVCYHGDERIGTSRDDAVLIQECLRRGLSNDDYYLAIIEARALPPWEPEEIEPLGPEHFDDAPAQP